MMTLVRRLLFKGRIRRETIVKENVAGELDGRGKKKGTLYDGGVLTNVCRSLRRSSSSLTRSPSRPGFASDARGFTSLGLRWIIHELRGTSALTAPRSA